MANDLAKCRALRRFDEHMDVIRHDAPSVKLIGRAMSSNQPRNEKVSARRQSQRTFAVASIKQEVKLPGEIAMILMALVVGKAREVFAGADAVSVEPAIALASPLGSESGRDRIREPCGDKVSGAPLPPMRQILTMHVRLRERVVRHERHKKKVVQGFSPHKPRLPKNPHQSRPKKVVQGFSPPPQPPHAPFNPKNPTHHPTAPPQPPKNPPCPQTHRKPSHPPIQSPLTLKAPPSSPASTASSPAPPSPPPSSITPDPCYPRSHT